MEKIKLGDIAKDRVTGFKGVVMGITKYLTGCDRYGLQPRSVTKDGKLPDWEWFDVTRLDLVKAGAVKLNSGQAGADVNAPQR